MIKKIKKNCLICKSHKLINLNISEKISITTDGNILKKKLNKVQCFDCGLFYNPNPIKIDNYHRSSGNSKWDIQRHKDIAKNISKLINRTFFSKKKILSLEIGGGNYLTSHFLSEFNNKLSVTSIEPYPENKPPKSKAEFLKLKIEDYVPKKKFDFIFSNNVIEHQSNPEKYLRDIDYLLSNNGFVLVCCPTQTKITNETLFIDHFFHFSEQSLRIIANKVGFAIDKQFISSWDPFTHCYLLKKTKKQKKIKNYISPKIAIKFRKSIIETYRHLDNQILDKIKNFKDSIYLFGAGEFSQLIRCYAPKFFKGLNSIVVSDKKGIRSFNKKIQIITDVKTNSGVIVLGVRKESVLKVINDLLKLGWSKNNIIRIN